MDPAWHFQFARALELPDMPMLRNTAYFVACGEGWALYAEQLGSDMGQYGDPSERMGQLAYQIWRAERLVHRLARPGAGLQDRPVAHHRTAHQGRTRTGPRFDLRDFNDAVLATGSVPLQVLERRMLAWIEDNRSH